MPKKMSNLRYKIYRIITGEDEGIVSFSIRLVLGLISFLYYIIIDLRLFCYEREIIRRERADCKVISVGNITWGGTGKTPLVWFLAEELRQAKKNFCILSRGYGGRHEELSDEIRFLKNKLKGAPILIGQDRVKNAKSAFNIFKIDTAILDDGFQYLKLARDLDIVVIDSTNPFGNGRLIPRGILREPIAGLKRADIFFLTKTDLAQNLYDLKKQLNKLNPDALIVDSVHKSHGLYNISGGARLQLSHLSGREIGLVCAVGNPESFRESVLKLGAKVELDLRFLDHHTYSLDDVRLLYRNCQTLGVETIVITEKDAVKLKDIVTRDVEKLTKIHHHIDFLVLQVKIAIVNNQDKFNERLLSIYIC